MSCSGYNDAGSPSAAAVHTENNAKAVTVKLELCCGLTSPVTSSLTCACCGLSAVRAFLKAQDFIF